MNCIRLSWLVVLMWMLPASWAAATTESEVVVTIKPLAMLVKAVVGDEMPVTVLMPANVSPHDYALRFSDVRALNEAALIVWVGPELESALRKPLAAARPEVLQLSALAEMQWPVSASKDDEHKSVVGQGESHVDHEHSRDLHLWLSPENSRVAVKAVAARLAVLYPDKAALFETNLNVFLGALDSFDQRARQRLEPLGAKGFVVTHDGYGHFIQYYGLKQLAAVQLSSGHQRGARHFAHILEFGVQVGCVFTEPQMNSKAARQLASQLGVSTAVLDPMGQQITLNRESYLEFMEGIIDTFASCLEESAQTGSG